jgi:hypothetical protein
MNSSFIISLDFELMWGVRDHRSVKNYGDAVLGGRQAIPLMLARFKEAGIRVTWATVGLLFAKNRKEMLEYAPKSRPFYEKPRLSPYFDIENALIGENEDVDPLHYGGSLISKIADTSGQEIATHTYSHFYCMEPGATEASFKEDLESARSIAENYSHKVQSIVFPRNQTAARFVHAASEMGLSTYRGGANGWLYQTRSGESTTKLLRLARFLDGALPIGTSQIVYPVKDMSMTNVPASRFLRPWTKNLAAYHHLHVRRIEAEMMLSAKTGGCYHLWWHPHNFGRNTIQNLHQLDRIIARFKYCRDEFGMVSRNMADLSLTTREVV